MIKAFQKDDNLLRDIEEARRDQSGFHLWWLGQSGFLIQWCNRHILIDPYLSDSLTVKYANTGKQHIRMTELVIKPEKLDFIDVVTSSHNHTDHLDGATLIPLLNVNPELEIVVPRANKKFVAERLQIIPERLICLNEGEQCQLESGIKIFGIPAAHNKLEKDDLGNCHFMGYIFQFGNYTIYHSGDTIWCEEAIEALRPFSIDVAILPINGDKPERRVAGNLNAEEAVRMAKIINARWLIPCHYHMFSFNTVDPDDFINIAREAHQGIEVLKCGARLTIK